MPKDNRPATRAQKNFMAKALERGYVPLSPSQVRYFNEVVNGGKPGRHSASTPHHTHAGHGHAYSTSKAGTREHVRHVPKKGPGDRHRGTR